jgi:hypothetical protein
LVLRFHTLAVVSRFSVSVTLDGNRNADRFRKYAFAESAIVTKAAPIIIASLTTSRPAPHN